MVTDPVCKDVMRFNDKDWYSSADLQKAYDKLGGTGEYTGYILSSCDAWGYEDWDDDEK